MATHIKKHTKNNKKHDFEIAEPGESYGIIKANKGGTPPTFEVEIIRTGKVIMAKLRNSLCKGPNKTFIRIGDTVLIQEGEKAYIINKYTDEEIKKLTRMGELVTFKPKSDASNIVFEDEMAALDREVENIVEIDIADI